MAVVTSKDGTEIEYEKSGSGPALVLVSGATGYRDMGYGNELVKLLEPHFTVVDYDRRGRGESGDTLPFALEREVEDIEALIGRRAVRRTCTAFRPEARWCWRPAWRWGRAR